MTLNLRKVIILLLLILLCLPSVYFSSLRGYHSPFTDVSDGDSTFIDQALRLNSGYPQTMFNHTDQILFYTLAFALKIGESLGMIPLSGIDQLKQSSDVMNDFAQTIYFSRYVLVFLSSLFVLIFTWCVTDFFQEVRMGLLAGAMLSVSQMQVHSLVIRPELIGTFLLVLGLFLLLSALRSHWKIKVFFASFCLWLSFMTKIQAIILALMFPGILVMFADKVILAQQWKQSNLISNGTIKKGVDVIIGFGWVVPFGVVWHALHPQNFHAYQVLLLLYLLGAMLLFKFLYQIPNRLFLLFIALMFDGIGAAYLLNYIQYEWQNIQAILEFVTWATNYSGSENVGGLQRIVDALFSVRLSSHFSPQSLIAFPIHLLALFTFISIGIFLLKKKLKVSLQLLMVFIIPIFGEGLFNLRYYSSLYIIYVDWIVIFGFLYASYALYQEFAPLKFKITLVSGIIVVFFIVMSFLNNQDRTQNDGYLGHTMKQDIYNFCSIAFSYDPGIREIISKNSMIHYGDFGPDCEVFVSESYNRLD
ncbi:hypothetical protein WDW89_09655 [Deltaproteobacteria bacterium TL4]